MTLLVGGYETAADLLSWALYLLSQHRDVESKLLDELATVLGGRAPSVSDLPHLIYCGHILSETLRLYPPAPALGREAISEFELDGHLVERGTDILVSQWVIQRDSRYFENPETFDPNRWTNGLADRLPRFAYFPFGGGPRICVGNAFATMETTLVLASIIQRYQLEPVPGQRVVPEMIPTLRPKYGLKMVLRRR
jgi:cytochrome P450